MGRWFVGNHAANFNFRKPFAMTQLYVVLFASLAVCIKAALLILGSPNPDGEGEQLTRLPPAF